MPNNSTQNIKLFIVINKMNTPSGSSLGIPMKPHMKIIDDLHYKYLFFLSSLDSDALVKMEEEEKRLFAYIVTYKQYLFTLDTPTEELRDFGKYTVRLTQSVVDNYLNIFQDKDLDLKEFLNDKIINSFGTLKRSLLDIVNSNQSLHYITCVLVCTSLLFLIRTTKRTLFMYLSQKNSTPGANANQNASNIKAVVGIEPRDINIKDKLANVILYIADYIASVQSLVVQEIEKYARMLAQVQQATNNSEQNRETLVNLQTELRKTKDNCASEVEDLKKQLAEQMENMQRLQNEEGKKQMLDKLESKTKELKNNLSGITQLANNFDKLFKRWDTNTKDKDIIALKMSAINEINKPTHEDNKLYQDAVDLLSDKLNQVSQSSFDGNLKTDTNNIIIQLVTALLQLGREKVIMKPDGLDVFFGGSQIYNKLVLLYEELSGAVRAVVRVRDVYASVTGGSRKRKIVAQESSSNKRRKLKISIGGGVEDVRFTNYEIMLDKKNKLVEFVGIDPSDKVFGTKTLQHGPFFSVHNNQLNDPTSTSIEDDLLRGIGFDSLVNMFNGTPEKDKEPAIVMYTYGYSGSGKSFTLFGEKTLNNSGLPKAGVMWEIVRRLQDKGFDLKLVSTTICYGYLDYANNGYVFKTNDPRPSSKNSTNVNQWANIINKDFADALQVVNDDSFIKVTPNNAESSRGFYIVKVALYERGSNYKNIKGYIGVVDMAGNEDPFDIATTICPTMKFDMMDTLLKDPIQSYVYDVVYEEIKNAILDILKPTILKVLTAKQKGFVTKDATSQSASKVLNETLVEGLQDRLITLRDKLDDTFELFKKRPVNYNKDNRKYISISSTAPYIFKYVNEKTKSSEELMEVPKVGDVKFYLNAELLQEICIYIQNKYGISNANNKTITINDIREAVLQGQPEKASTLKLQYAVTRVFDLMKWRKGKIIVTMNIDVQNVSDEIIKDRYNGARNIIQSSIIKSMENFNNQPYILPFEMNNKLIEYSYSTIARIIKEGYYINKANAELMDYFKKKLHMQDVNKIVTVNRGYNFDASFAFTSYNKFARDFVPMVKSNTNSSQRDFEYDTGLVDIIKQQFPGKNKDIIFACVRNDKDFGKILGAIDTLELIRDLKST
jgi:hypothetical protein